MRYRLLLYSVLLAALFALDYQSRVISFQKQLILEMAQNPQCISAPPARPR
jgi:hypothetical protein